MINRLVIISLFTAQIFLIVYARFTEERYFCWAPYDQISQYKFNVFLDHRKLSEKEIYNRYKKKSDGFENRNINNLKFLLTKAEKSIKGNKKVKIELTYSTNNRKEEIWLLESPNYEWICNK